MFTLRRPELHAAVDLPMHHFPRCIRVAASGVCAMLLCLGCALRCAGQGPVDGAIEGTVQDVNGKPVPAMVIARASDTGLERRTRAGANGHFLLAHLVPGAYTVLSTSTGLPFVGRAQIVVSLGETSELHLSVGMALLATTITVQGEDTAPSFFRGGTDRSGTSINANELRQLPSAGSREQDFALTTDGVLPDQDADGLLSVHGLPSTQNSILLDGADANQSFGSVPAGTGIDAGPNPAEDSDSADLTTGPSQGLSRSRHAGVAYAFSQVAVKEFRISTQNYSALTGNAAGGVATMISKAGTAQPHGTGFFVLRSQALAAADPSAIATSYAAGVVSGGVVKPHDLRENFGGTFGGPVLPGMLSGRPLFYFAAYDQQRRGFPAVSSPANPAFYSLTPIQLGLLGTRGVKTSAIGSALNYLSSLTGLTSRRQDQNIGFGRLDWTASQRQDLGLQYNRVRWNSPAGLTDAPLVARARNSLGNAAGSLDAVLLRATTTLSPRWINQLSVQYLRDLQYETPQQNLPQEPAVGPGGLAPEVNIGPDGLLFGTPAGLSQQAFPDERRIEAGDTVTVQRGRQLLQLGGSISAVHDRVATLANAEGTFRYDSTRTAANAGGLVDFITDATFNVKAYPNGGCPSISAAVHVFCFTSFSQSFGEQRVAFSTQELAGFVEDTWRPRNGLAFHAGVRYEYLRLPPPVAPNAALDQIFGAQGETSFFPEDRDNLGPRVGASWEPFGAGRGVVRIGYGTYFGRLPGATIRSALADTGLAGSTLRVRITPSVETSCPQVQGQGFGYPCSFLAQPPGVVATTGSATVFDRHFRLPTVQQASLGVERSLGRSVTLSAAYEMNLDRQLPSSTDLNIAPSTSLAHFQIQAGAQAKGVTPGETFVVPLYTARVSSAFGPVTEIVSHVNATYSGLTVAAVVLGLRGVSARMSYSWSKALDYGANASATPRTDGQFDPFNIAYDKGLSSLNYPEALHFSGVWSPRVHSVSALARKTLNGWEVAPIVLGHSGMPYSYEIYGGPQLRGGHESINGSGGALYLPTVGRNTLRLPTSVNADLRVSRGFTPEMQVAGQPLTLRLSAEVFNVTNRRNVSSVEERGFLVGTATDGVTPLIFQDAGAIAAEGLNTQAFGAPTASSSSLARERQIQLSLRVDF